MDTTTSSRNGAVAKPLAVKTFTAELVEEYSAVPTRMSLGVHHNRMELYIADPDYGNMIIWSYGRKAPDEDETVIGLGIEGKQVVDYDGVFELPKEARELLIEAGYDLTEVGYDANNNEIDPP